LALSQLHRALALATLFGPNRMTMMTVKGSALTSSSEKASSARVSERERKVGGQGK